MIGPLLRIYHLPNINLAIVGPTTRLVFGHHPEGGEVTFPTTCLYAALDAAIRKAELATAPYTACNHRHVIYRGVRVGYCAGNQFAILNVHNLLAVAQPTVPSGSLSHTTRPPLACRLRAIGNIELIAEHQLPFAVGAVCKLGDNLNLAIYILGRQRHNIGRCRHHLLAPLLVAIDILLALYIVAVAHNHLACLEARSSWHQLELQLRHWGHSHWQRRIIGGNDTAVESIEVQWAVARNYIYKEIDHHTIVGNNCSRTGRRYIIYIGFHTGTIYTGRHIIGEIVKR